MNYWPSMLCTTSRVGVETAALSCTELLDKYLNKHRLNFKSAAIVALEISNNECPK